MEQWETGDKKTNSEVRWLDRRWELEAGEKLWQEKQGQFQGTGRKQNGQWRTGIRKESEKANGILRSLFFDIGLHFWNKETPKYSALNQIEVSLICDLCWGGCSPPWCHSRTQVPSIFVLLHSLAYSLVWSNMDTIPTHGKRWDRKSRASDVLLNKWVRSYL